MRETPTALGDPSTRLRQRLARPSQRSGVTAFLFLLVAVASAVATMALLSAYLDEQLTGAEVRTVPVVVAKVEIPLGTPLQADHLTLVQWPDGTAPDGVFSAPDSVTDRVAISKIHRGEPILASKLAALGAGAGLAAVLPAGVLAASVRVDDVVGVAGFIHPGDRVEVIATMRPEQSNSSPPISKVILQNITVLAVGKQVDRDDRSSRTSIPATVATLMVTHAEAESLALVANGGGKLLLALRSAVDQDIVATNGVVATRLLASALPPPKQSKARAPVRLEKRIVEILRGDERERRAFTESEETSRGE